MVNTTFDLSTQYDAIHYITIRIIKNRSLITGVYAGYIPFTATENMYAYMHSCKLTYVKIINLLHKEHLGITLQLPSYIKYISVKSNKSLPIDRPNGGLVYVWLNNVLVM